jgi:hypothetical protein
MKRGEFTDEQILLAVKNGKEGRKVADRENRTPTFGFTIRHGLRHAATGGRCDRGDRGTSCDRSNGLENPNLAKGCHRIDTVSTCRHPQEASSEFHQRREC